MDNLAAHNMQTGAGDPAPRTHFIGIGGAGMSALAEALLDMGGAVSGSDLVASDATRDLERRGARVFVGHAAENVGDVDRVVITGAVPQDNPELVAARERGLPVIKRAELLGQLMDLRRGVAVAGTHGKTTTSAMIAWVLAKADRAPSYMVGGTIRGLGPGGHWGGGDILVAEADEYDRSFLHLRPWVAVITNIENDHLEYYGTAEAILEAFEQFAASVRPGGLLLAGSDDQGSRRLAALLEERHAPFRAATFGVAAGADWRPLEATANAVGGYDYVAVRGGSPVTSVSLRVPGMHNVLNSLAALAACVELGVGADMAAGLLGTYEGAGRRFEVRGEASGVTVVDDYAHHPTEIAATLAAARSRYPGRRLVVLFQPHTYTRTRDFLADFVRTLSLPDRVVVAEIYASREHDTLGMTSKQIVEQIPDSKAAFAPTLADAEDLLLAELKPGDVLMTMGAGDVWKAGEHILQVLRGRDARRPRH